MNFQVNGQTVSPFDMRFVGVARPPVVYAVISRPLTPRQNEVLEAFIRTRNRKAAAKELGLTAHTIDQHLSTIATNLGLETSEDLIAWVYGGQQIAATNSRKG